MKTKLTLTVNKNIIQAARKRSRSTGKSISGLFEEAFKEIDGTGIETEPQRAAKRLLKLLDKSERIPVQNDKAVLKKYIKKKYA